MKVRWLNKSENPLRNIEILFTLFLLIFSDKRQDLEQNKQIKMKTLNEIECVFFLSRIG